MFTSGRAWSSWWSCVGRGCVVVCGRGLGDVERPRRVQVVVVLMLSVFDVNALSNACCSVRLCVVLSPVV